MKGGSLMKEKILPIFALLGGLLSSAVGGFDYGFQSLLICMGIDYVSGLCVAGIFHKSTKSESGALKSSECFRGLVKKCMIIGIVAVGHRIDGVVGTTFIRDGMVIGFMLNEVISIVENVGLMGLPLPKIVVKAIDLLRSKAGEDDEKPKA